MQITRNHLYDWAYIDGNLIGYVVFDQPGACVKTGDLLRTSKVERIYRRDGFLFALTKNSKYRLL